MWVLEWVAARYRPQTLYAPPPGEVTHYHPYHEYDIGLEGRACGWIIVKERCEPDRKILAPDDDDVDGAGG